MKFELHPQLASDCFEVGKLRINRLLMMNDSRFLWTILVPELPELKDLHDLPRDHHTDLFDDIDQVSRVIQRMADADKINVAALGNQVPQLHVHVIARTLNDAAWPAPVWGLGKAVPYAADESKAVLSQLSTRLRL